MDAVGDTVERKQWQDVGREGKGGIRADAMVSESSTWVEGDAVFLRMGKIGRSAY